MKHKKQIQLKKTAIVTGASQGIGRMIALGLAEDGYHIALIARSINKLKALANEIQHISNQQALIYPLDITDFKNVDNIVADILTHWKHIDVLFNGAGIYKDGTLSLPLDDYQDLFNVNVKGALAFLLSVVPVMKKQKHGHIFNVASTAGKVGYPGRGGYVTSKFALVGLSESLHHELAEQGIRVTALCPGYVATNMARQAGSTLKKSQMIQQQDILETVRWLLKLSPAACVKEVLMECSCYV